MKEHEHFCFQHRANYKCNCADPHTVRKMCKACWHELLGVRAFPGVP